jgi:F-type H+-transporting ATPase subunit a
MPEHSSFLTLLMAHIRDTLSHNVDLIGQGLVFHGPATWQSFEPLLAAIFVALLLLLIAGITRARIAKLDDAVIPEERLTLRTFVELFLGYFYDMAASIMGHDRARRYYGIIGTSACFVFLANVLALIPGMPVATSHLSITFGCALVVFILFNYYGIRAVGAKAYLGHLFGPVWWLAWLLFPIEVISLCVRPVTLAVRLMVNMTADHLLVAAFLGLFPLLLPLPVMLLGVLVVAVQTLVFTMLTSVYISLATEHEEREPGHAHAHAQH